jgi:hypothetical protein
MRWIDVDAAVTLRVNLVGLTDDGDFKSRETGITYNESGMDLVWNFETTAGVITQTAVTPTTSGDYDWTHIGDGLYKIEMPDTGGASANNDTEGFGYFTGLCDGVLHWAGPTYGFRAAALNNLLVDGAGDLALESTLAAMKGAGWSAETLVTIEAAINALTLTGARTITIQLYETATTTPIAGVSISVYNSDQTLFLGRLTTNSNGQIVIGRDDETFKLVFTKAGATFTTPETMVVTEDATKTYYGDSAVISAPSDSDVCRVYEWLFLPDGESNPAAVNAIAEITKLPYDKDSKLHSGDAIEGTYDSGTGLVYWDIVRGATARFRINDFITTTKVVPDLATQRLKDI